MGAAPGEPGYIKQEAEKRGITEYAATIPTLGVQLVAKHLTNKATGQMRPKEGDLIKKKWEIYTLILVSCAV